MGFGNFPDGRYGLYYEDAEREKVFNSFLVEFYTTRNQRQQGELREYLSHGIYRSGFTYMNRVLATPFFSTYDDMPGISNNKFSALHIGTGGLLPVNGKQYPYKLLFSVDHREGSWTNWINPNENNYYAYVNSRILEFNDSFRLNFELSAGINSERDSSLGGGLHLIYVIEPRD
jgi:hypothetical protein